MNNSLKIAVATVNQTPIDWANNKKNILDVLAEAKNEHVDLLCFPELCITGYGCEDLFLGEWIYKRAFKELLNLLSHTEGIAVSLGIPIRFEGHNYNCACMIADGKILGFTAKQFMANDGVHYEKRWFEPWKADKIDQLTIDLLQKIII